MAFEFKKFLSPEKLKAEESISEPNRELLQELKHPTILERFRGTRFLKRIVSLTLLLSATETFGQDKGKHESSVESAKKAVLELDAFAKNKPDKTGEVNILGFGRSKFVEKNLGTKQIHSNDFYLYIRDEKTGADGSTRTEYGVDVGKDGTVDQVVIVPGKVDKAEDAFIVTDFGSDVKSIAGEAEMASMEREMHDKPALHRTVYLLEKATGQKWHIVNFEDGTTQESGDGTKPQAWWEAKTNLAAADAKERK